ncbi:acyltransferase family protein [Pseudarthrobacter sp. MDT1-22]
MGGAYALSLGWTIEQLCIAGVIATITTDPASLLTRAFSWRPLTSVGVISFSLYLWQQLFLTDLMPQPFSNPLLGIPLAFGAACFSYWCVEKPFLRLKNRFHTGAAFESGDLSPVGTLALR